MSEFAEGTGEGTQNKSFWGNLPDVPGYLEKKLPTMDRSLDAYLDKNFEAIIEEWGLLREDDLIELERRLDRVTEDVNRLSAGKVAISDRVNMLETVVSRLEGRVRK
jgi:hypothetical protein